MSGFIKEVFTVLVLVLLFFAGSMAAAKVIKCVSINNQPYMIRLTLLDLNFDEFHYYPFVISMNRSDGSCNTTEHPFGQYVFLMKRKTYTRKYLI